MRLVVQDANIIIDLIECEIFNLFFRLKQEVITTSLVLSEINRAQQQTSFKLAIRNKWLQVIEIDTIEYLHLQSLNLPGLSVTDKFVLKLAEDRDAYLLTGDGKLRKTAEGCDVDVRGILWIFDQLVENNLLSPKDAYAKLEILRHRNQRLPQKEIDRRLKVWRS